MPNGDSLVFLIMGGVFVVVGIGAYFWGRYEENRYYNSLYTRVDVKEFLSRFPKHPEPIALKIGGRIAIVVGLGLLALGGVFWWRG